MAMNLPDLRGRAALLTGGAQGIGEFTVRELARHGVRVTFCDVDEKRGRIVAAATGARFLRADVSREADVRRLVREVVRREERLDLLINNAGLDTRIPLEKTSANDWQRLTDINLRHALLTAREAAPQMKKQRRGVIVNFSSISFFGGFCGYIAYLTSKAGIIGLTRGLARELGPFGIRVNAVAPGWVMTERQLKMYATPRARRMCLERQCLKELLQPEEIAQLVAFLCSDASRSLTGQTILADKGWFHH